MANRRMIYQSVFQNTNLRKRPYWVTVLWIGVIIEADNGGMLPADPDRLRCLILAPSLHRRCPSVVAVMQELCSFCAAGMLELCTSSVRPLSELCTSSVDALYELCKQGVISHYRVTNYFRYQKLELRNSRFKGKEEKGIEDEGNARAAERAPGGASSSRRKAATPPSESDPPGSADPPAEVVDGSEMIQKAREAMAMLSNGMKAPGSRRPRGHHA